MSESVEAPRRGMRTSEGRIVVTFAGGLVATAFATASDQVRVVSMLCATLCVCCYAISRGLSKRRGARPVFIPSEISDP